MKWNRNSSPDQLAVADAPAAWNAKMQASLGITPPTDREGILQDVHWSGGGIGYFPTYTLGNILAAQLFDSAAHALPSLRADIQYANFTGLYNGSKPTSTTTAKNTPRPTHPPRHRQTPLHRPLPPLPQHQIPHGVRSLTAAAMTF